MLIKAGVDISRLERNTRRGLAVVNKVYAQMGEEIVVTSTYEGNHGAGSLHYADQAFDVGLPQNDPIHTVAEMRQDLGEDFDVEGEIDHIHIEYDPK